MSYVIQASPLTKMFLPEWHDRCLKNPEILKDTAPFKVRIPRAVGSIELTHGVPTLASSLVIHTRQRKIVEDEVSPLIRWLTDENDPETDIYGVVAVNIETDMADAVMALVYKGDKTKTASLIDEIQHNLANSIRSARERADARVLRQCGTMYNFVRATVNEMQKNNKGVYSPSYTEALALDVLKDTIKQRRAPDERAAKIMNEALSDMADIGVR